MLDHSAEYIQFMQLPFCSFCSSFFFLSIHSVPHLLIPDKWKFGFRKCFQFSFPICSFNYKSSNLFSFSLQFSKVEKLSEETIIWNYAGRVQFEPQKQVFKKPAHATIERPTGSVYLANPLDFKLNIVKPM
jgi:hypothetical protein